MAVRRILAAALTAPLLTLAACGGGGSIADPPISSAPSSSPPTQHRETPEHFIRRWAAEDTRIQKTGDTAHFRQMSVGCRGCTKLANLVERIYKGGGFIHTRGWTVTKITKGDSGSFDMYVRASSTSYAATASGVVHRLPSGPAHFQLQLQPRKSSWNVSSLVQVAS